MPPRRRGRPVTNPGPEEPRDERQPPHPPIQFEQMAVAMQTLVNVMANGSGGDKLARVQKIVKPFNGTSLDPAAATKWIISIERAFQVHDIPNDKKVDYASVLLEDEAHNWWISQQQLIGERVAWERFKEVFLDHHFPTPVKNKMREEFYQLKQKGRSIQEYERDFSRLLKFAPLSYQNDEETKVEKFKMGLDVYYQAELKRGNSVRYADVVNEARMLEQVREMKRGEGSSHKRKSGGNLKKSQTNEKSKRPYKSPEENQKRQEIKRACWKCDKNHLARECPELKGKCYRCGETGHMARQCQNPKDIRCFNCGQLGHIVTNCQANVQGNQAQTIVPTQGAKPTNDIANPRRGRPKPQTQARVYAMQHTKADNEDEVITGE